MAAVSGRALETVSLYAEPGAERRFFQVSGKDPKRMRVIADIFRRILEPLYGNQEKAIGQIRESKDRRCFLLYEKGNPVGVLVFKTEPSDEFAHFGVSRSIEVKSLFVDDSKHNSGRGLGSSLIAKLWEEVSFLGVPCTGVHLTVSETKEDSLAFFQKKGFSIQHEWRGRYQKGVVEYLLSCPSRIGAAAAASVATITHGMEALNTDEQRSGTAGVLCYIRDAHLGRIHTLIPLSDGTFITGSEDNCLYKWSRDGEKVCSVYEVEPTLAARERDWVTAAAVVNDAYWVSGLRSGRISVWTTAGEHVRDILPKLPNRRNHHSQEYNKQRVNCFAASLDENRSGLFVGLPTMISEYNWIEGRTASMIKVDDNDWVYCIHPLDANRMLAVIGGHVDLIERRDDTFSSTTLLSEGKRVRVQKGSRTISQRPFISSLKPVGDAHNFGLALFDGSVKVMDANNGSIVADWCEHKGRVWSIERLTSQQFASCGDDGLIKLWDSREAASVKTIEHGNPVNSMLSLTGNTFIAGVSEAKRSAALFFHDLRTV